MKILVLSHQRCGSTTLCKWLSKELNFELDESPYNPKQFNDVFGKNNIVRKIVVEEYLPTKEEIHNFDKVLYSTTPQMWVTFRNDTDFSQRII